jgi:hypothetical protein
MQPDLPALRAQWAQREEVKEPVVGPAVVGNQTGHKH